MTKQTLLLYYALLWDCPEAICQNCTMWIIWELWCIFLGLKDSSTTVEYLSVLHHKMLLSIRCRYKIKNVISLYRIQNLFKYPDRPRYRNTEEIMKLFPPLCIYLVLLDCEALVTKTIQCRSMCHKQKDSIPLHDGRELYCFVSSKVPYFEFKTNVIAKSGLSIRLTPASYHTWM